MSNLSNNPANEGAEAGPEQFQGLELAITEVAGDPLAAPGHPRKSRFGLAVAISLLLHGALAWAGVHYIHEDVLGGADVEVETISVEIVGAVPQVASPAQANALNATRQPTPATPIEVEPSLLPPHRQAAAKTAAEKQAPAETLNNEINDNQAQARTKSAPKQLPNSTSTQSQLFEPNDFAGLPDKAVEPAKPAPYVEDIPAILPEPPQEPEKQVNAKIASPVLTRSTEREDPPQSREPNEVIAVEAQKLKQPKKPSKTAAKTEQETQRSSKRTATNAAQSSSASSRASESAAARPKKVVPASKGALRVFARRIARALARSRPRGIPGSGTVVIAFTLSPSGALTSVRVRKSSGSARLDRAAKRAVRRTKFPRPPKGATRAQRSFVIPYHFRRR